MSSYIDEYLTRRLQRAARPVTPTFRMASQGREVAGRAWSRARHYLLPVTGFGLLTTAAGTWHPWAGLVVAGAACFVLDYNSGGRS